MLHPHLSALPPRVLALANKARVFGELYYTKHSEAYTPELQGLCAIVSKVLYDFLREESYKTTFVVGRFQWNACFKTYEFYNHAWVEFDRWIIDPTATQFGYKDKILLIHPEVHPLETRKYLGCRRGETAIKEEFKRWKLDNNPWEVKNQKRISKILSKM